VVSEVAERVLYRDIVPYDVPSSLDALRGPVTGVLELPVTVHWGPQRVYDLATSHEMVFAYQQIVREGTTADQERLLNREVLVRVWSELILPPRCQRLWETRFCELATVRQ
jgi:hypothetical protein